MKKLNIAFLIIWMLGQSSLSNAQWNSSGNDIHNINVGNVGIGTDSLILSKLHVEGGLLATGTIGGTPISGAGTRLMWIPSKAAFRAGMVLGSQWDDVKIGANSVSLGFNNVASGSVSVAIGQDVTAAGQNSMALGYQSAASGSFSFVSGFNSLAAGHASFAFGNNSFATGANSLAMGHYSNAFNDHTITLGYYVNAESPNSVVIGSGYEKSNTPLRNTIPRSLMVGFNSDIPTLFVGTSRGEGTFGQVGIGTTIFQSDSVKLAVNGKLTAKELELTMNGWPDYVFSDNYELLSLTDLELYINTNNHLPGVPRAESVEESGLNVGTISKVMMEKIEELTLYVIELKKEIEKLKTETK